MAELERSHGRVDIAQDGHTMAALVSAEHLESLEETVAVAADPELVAAIAGEGRPSSMLARASPHTTSRSSF
ncbi:MAG: hypothetical protein DLM61_14330 [Pseudonocardiales bacterium]|nr:MAG: hypothetical protein DLM61_14330 [Pseudonocardiales bacterium]